jgi:Rab GTPase-binding effector protein 1
MSRSHSGSTNSNLSQENENLEEDMRKAKESADLLKAVVLPLETEIVTLKNDLDVSKKRVIELENLIYKVCFKLS